VNSRSDEALATTQETVDRYRALAQSNPDAFLPNLATSLGAHAQALRAAGQEDAALSHFLQGADCVLAVAVCLPPVLARLVAALLRDAAQSVNKLEADPTELLRLIDRYNALVSPEQP
jgi:hypothetical protein